MSPPCDINIETELPCATKGKRVTLQLLDESGSVVRERNRTSPFFFFPRNRANNLEGRLRSGTYKIQVVANGVVQPNPHTFTLVGSCVGG